jgi:hypothetical protein
MSEIEEAKTVCAAGVRSGGACGERDPFSPRRCILPSGHAGLHRDSGDCSNCRGVGAEETGARCLRCDGTGKEPDDEETRR